MNNMFFEPTFIKQRLPLILMFPLFQMIPFWEGVSFSKAVFGLPIFQYFAVEKWKVIDF